MNGEILNSSRRSQTNSKETISIAPQILTVDSAVALSQQKLKCKLEDVLAMWENVETYFVPVTKVQTDILLSLLHLGVCAQSSLIAEPVSEIDILINQCLQEQIVLSHSMLEQFPNLKNVLAEIEKVENRRKKLELADANLLQTYLTRDVCLEFSIFSFRTYRLQNCRKTWMIMTKR